MHRVAWVVRRLLHPSANFLGEFRRLIHNYSAIDDVSEASRHAARWVKNRSSKGECPDGDDGGLTQTRGEFYVGVELTGFEFTKKAILPAARAIVSCESAICGIELFEAYAHKQLMKTEIITDVLVWHPAFAHAFEHVSKLCLRLESTVRSSTDYARLAERLAAWCVQPGPQYVQPPGRATVPSK